MKTRLLAMVALAVALAAPVQAHHSLGNYDQSTLVTVRGTVSEIRWLNPHASITLKITMPDGTTDSMQIGMAAPMALIRKGFDKAFLNRGDTITVEVWRLKDPKASADVSGRTLILADGRRFDVADNWSQMSVTPLTNPPR